CGRRRSNSRCRVSSWRYRASCDRCRSSWCRYQPSWRRYRFSWRRYRPSWCRCRLSWREYRLSSRRYPCALPSCRREDRIFLLRGACWSFALRRRAGPTPQSAGSCFRAVRGPSPLLTPPVCVVTRVRSEWVYSVGRCTRSWRFGCFATQASHTALTAPILTDSRDPGALAGMCADHFGGDQSFSSKYADVTWCNFPKVKLLSREGG